MTIYDYITEQRNKYQQPIEIEDGWSWGMKDHLRKSFLYLNSQFAENNEDRVLRPNKNIVLSIMNVQFRTEGFDVKDIELFVDDVNLNYKSALTRKFHDKWALDNDLDTFIDETVEGYCTYGGALTRNTGEAVPMNVDLRTLDFCNQRNILANPFGIKHELSQSELRGMAKYGWGDVKNGATMDIEELITIVKKEDKDVIELVEVHGVLPSEWLEDEYHEVDPEKKDIQQMQVVAFYTDSNKHEVGVTLFKSEEPNLNFKFLSRDRVEKRALGRGGVEELFEPQIWTNWNEIKIAEMLDSASKTIILSDDPSLSAKHPSGLKNVDNLEIIEHRPGTVGAKQMDTYPRNLAVFNQSVETWSVQAKELGSANDSLLGKNPSSGTPFKLQELVTQEGKGMHTYRQGKIARYMDEIYRDWILPYISKEITNGTTFLSELSSEEMLELSEQVSENAGNREAVEMVLSGKGFSKQEVELKKEEAKTSFLKAGNKKFITILKDEFKKHPLAVRTNIAGKQKNLGALTDKVVNVLRQYIATPEIRQDPSMNKLLNIILESSGLSPIMFNPMIQQQAVAPQGGGNTDGLKEITKQKDVQPNS